MPCGNSDALRVGPIQVHMGEGYSFHRGQTRRASQLQDRLRSKPVRKWWSPLLILVGPLEDDDPLACHPSGLCKSGDGLIRLMEHMAEKHEVKEIVSERETLCNSRLKRSVRNKMPGNGQESRIRVNPCDAERPSGKSLCKDTGPCSNVEDALHRETFRAELNHPFCLQELEALWRSKAFSRAMEATLVRTRAAVFHSNLLRLHNQRIYRITGASWHRIPHSSFP